MSNDYWVEIVDGKMIGTPQPIFAKVMPPLKDDGFSNFLIGIPLQNTPGLISILVRHPEGCDVDASNWGSFLHSDIWDRPDHKHDLTPGGEKIRGYRSITARGIIGNYFFLLKVYDRTIGLLLHRNPSIRDKVRSMSKALIVLEPEKKNDYITNVHYNDRKIVVQSSVGRVNPRDKLFYQYLFDRSLSPSEEMRLYIEGDANYDWESIPYRDRSDLELTLRKISLFGFTYFESVDEKVIFTLMPDPTVKLFAALHELVGSMDREGIDTTVLANRYAKVIHEWCMSSPSSKESLRTTVLSGILLLKEFAPHMT
jgi:hypothetical protein